MGFGGDWTGEFFWEGGEVTFSVRVAPSLSHHALSISWSSIVRARAPERRDALCSSSNVARAARNARGGGAGAGEKGGGGREQEGGGWRGQGCGCRSGGIGPGNEKLGGGWGGVFGGLRSAQRRERERGGVGGGGGGVVAFLCWKSGALRVGRRGIRRRLAQTAAARCSRHHPSITNSFSFTQGTEMEKDSSGGRADRDGLRAVRALSRPSFAKKQAPGLLLSFVSSRARAPGDRRARAAGRARATHPALCHPPLPSPSGGRGRARGRKEEEEEQSRRRGRTCRRWPRLWGFFGGGGRRGRGRVFEPGGGFAATETNPSSLRRSF